MTLDIKQVNVKYLETLSKEEQVQALKNAGLNASEAKSFLKKNKIKPFEHGV